MTLTNGITLFARGIEFYLCWIGIFTHENNLYIKSDYHKIVAFLQPLSLTAFGDENSAARTRSSAIIALWRHNISHKCSERWVMEYHTNNVAWVWPSGFHRPDVDLNRPLETAPGHKPDDSVLGIPFHTWRTSFLSIDFRIREAYQAGLVDHA